MQEAEKLYRSLYRNGYPEQMRAGLCFWYRKTSENTDPTAICTPSRHIYLSMRSSVNRKYWRQEQNG